MIEERRSSIALSARYRRAPTNATAPLFRHRVGRRQPTLCITPGSGDQSLNGSVSSSPPSRHAKPAGVVRQKLRQATVAQRALIQIGTGQKYAALAQPGIHLPARKQLLGVFAANQAAGAVHREVERGRCLSVVHTHYDHRVIGHGTLDKAALAGKG